MTKTIFITGASTGLGRATAKLFADRDWNVIATMRNTDAGADLAAHDRITALKLDVTPRRRRLSNSAVSMSFSTTRATGLPARWRAQQMLKWFARLTPTFWVSSAPLTPCFRTCAKGVRV